MASPTPETDGGNAAPPPGGRRTLVRWLESTSNRSFVFYPVCVVIFELARRGGDLAFVPWGTALLIWGYLQYVLVGRYRTRLGGGGPGLGVPPLRIVDQGPYKVLRNPMYLGHLIFIAGLAITFRSLPAVALLAFNMVWFNRRVLKDERRLEEIFGAEYDGYKARVKRWIPGML